MKLNLASFNKKWLRSYHPCSLSGYDKLLAFFLALFSFVFYALHLTPGVSAGDNGELSSAVYYLGVAHAPGYPIHTLFAKIFTFIPFGNVAWRVNLFSAFCGALTIYFAALVYLKILFSLGGNKVYIYLSTAIGAVAFTMSKTLWGQSITTEVYTISALFHPLLFYILLKWQESIIAHDNSKEIYLGENYLLVFGFLLGIGLGGHQTIIISQLFTLVFLATFFVIFQVLRKPNYQLFLQEYRIHFIAVLSLVVVAWLSYFYYIVRYSSNLFINNYANLKPGVTIFVLCYIALLFYYLFFRWGGGKGNHQQVFYRLSLATIKFFGMIFLGFTIYFYIFIRAHGNPPLNWGGINELNDIWGKLAKFFTMINRKQFPPNLLPINLFNLLTQLKLLFVKVTYSQYAWPFFIVMLVGLFSLFKKSRLWFCLLIFTFIIYNVFLTLYIKFDFNEQDLFFIEVFYIYSYFILSIFIPLGIYELLSLSDKLLSKFFLKKTNPPIHNQAKEELQEN